MKQGTKANQNSIYLLKVIATIMILLHHYYCLGGYVGWYIGVEFFFIVSGYLLWKKIDTVDNIFSAVWTRIKRLYPAYLEAILILIYYRAKTGQIASTDVVDVLKLNYAEIFMVHLFGAPIYRGFWVINDVGWYVAAMLIATIVFLLLHKFLGTQKWLKYVILAAVVIFYGYNCIYKNIGMDFWAGIRYPNDSIFRALAAMGVGILLVELAKEERLTTVIREYSVIFNVLAAVAFVFVWRYTFLYPNTKYDVLMIALFAFVVFVAFYAKTNILFDNPVIRYLNEASYEVYLNQLVILYLFLKYIPQMFLFETKNIVMFVVVCFGFGIVLHEINRLIGKFVSKLFKFVENIKELS